MVKQLNEVRLIILAWLCCGLAFGQTLKVFVLTGQSNSLGTLAATDNTMNAVAAGEDPIDARVLFFWDNRADGTPAGNAGLGNSAGWTTLGPQTGGYYPGNDDHWGPEVGFARMLWRAGYRDFAIVKASRGGGGNSFWVKDSADDHMYDHVVETVNAAVAALPAGYISHELAGLLYVQGESNNAIEADEAGTRFASLLENLRVDLPNAASIRGILGEIGGGSTNARNLTRSRQATLANSEAGIGYASAVGTTQHDGLHYDADSILLLGERMAAAALGAGCFSNEPLPAWAEVHAWYLADSGIRGASTVDRWADLADGSGTHDLTRTVNGGPGRKSVTAAGEVRQVMDFRGSADLWASSDEFGSLSNGRSVAVICRVPTAMNGYLWDGSTSNGRTRVQVRDGDWQAGVANSWDVAEGVTAPLEAGEWQRHVWTFDEVGASTEITHWINGVEAGTASDTNSGALSGFIVGSNGGSPIKHLEAEVAEVAIFNKVLDFSEITELESLWNTRWGTITGPPLSISVLQEDRMIPRFSWHEMMTLTIALPAPGSTLEKVSLTLKPGTRERIRALRLRGAGGVLGQVEDPATDTLSLTVSQALAQGSNELRLEVEPHRWGTLGGEIDATLDEIVLSGNEAGSAVPTDDDPLGALTLAAMPLVSDVRRSGDYGIATYRIPGIACDDQGVLHAVFDHRWSGGSDLPADVDVGYARSEDGGASWSGFQPILDFDASVPGSSGNGVGDPAILWDPATRTLWVAALWSFGNNGYLGSGAGTNPVDTGQYVLTKSEDGGLSWSPSINVTVDVKDDPNWRLIFQGPGHGLAMRNGTLVFPSQYINSSGVVRMCSVYSSDHGVTWDFGSGIPDSSPQTNENTVCELDDGRLLFSGRTPSGSNGQRAWAYYTPGGAAPMRDGSWTDVFRLASVPDPVCQGSVIQWKSTLRGDPLEIVAFVNPGSSSSRANLTLRASADGGATWPVSRLLYGGSSAYSSACILPDRSLGILFEKDNYTRITFMRVEQEWLWNAEVDGDGDGMPDAWEVLHGTDPEVDDAGADADGDGSPNRVEYIAGTAPLDRASVFRLTSWLKGGGGGNLSWSTVPGRSYAVENSTNLEEWNVVERLKASGTALSRSVQLDAATGFYRVRVE